MVYIAFETWNLHPDSAVLTFIHELGNILDARINPYDPNNPDSYEKKYGNPQSPTGDADTGQALQDCMSKDKP